MATFTIRILHVSDLHERVLLDWMPDERKAKIKNGAAQRHRVLGDKLMQTLGEVRESRPIDMVCFTGDVADWGLPGEYDVATARVHALMNWSGVDMQRLFVVPGNHDVQRREVEAVWKEMRTLAFDDRDGLAGWMAGEKKPRGTQDSWRDDIRARTTAFWNWVDKDLGRGSLRPGAGRLHPRLGYREILRLPEFPFDVHIVGLDSAWLAGDDGDAKKLFITKPQIDRLTRDDQGKTLPGFRLALVHHPLGELADQDETKRLLADSVDLLLHGHQHEPIAEEQRDPDRTLRVLAAGSLFEGDYGDKWRNAFNVIDVQLDENGKPLQYDVDFWGWSERGFWHKTGAIYEHAPNGHLRWKMKRSVTKDKSAAVRKPPSKIPPANPGLQESHTSVVLDRIKQWTPILEHCASRQTHLVFIVHGTPEQDLPLFIRRIKSYLHEECREPPHRVIEVERKHEKVIAKKGDEWKRCIIAKTAAAAGELNVVLPRETARSCPVYLFTEGGGPIRDLDKETVKGLVSLFRDQIDPVVKLLEADNRLHHPLRFIIPIEHAQAGGSPLLKDLVDGLQGLRALHLEPLREIDFPPWDEVWDYVTKEFDGAGKDAELESQCREINDEIAKRPNRTLRTLGDALHPVLYEWEENDQRKRRR